MCLCEDRGGAEEAEGREGALAWLRAPGLPPDQPPTPARDARPPRYRRPLRCWDPLSERGPAGRGKRGPPARPGRSQKAKVRRAALQVFPTSPPAAAGVLLLGASPPSSGVAERKGTGRGRGRGRRKREPKEEWRVRQHLLKLGGGGMRGGRGGEEERRERAGGKHGTEGQLFHPVSSAGSSVSGRGAPPPCEGFQAGMGPFSRKWIGRREGQTVGGFFLSLSSPSLPRLNQIRTVTQGL